MRKKNRLLSLLMVFVFAVAFLAPSMSMPAVAMAASTSAVSTQTADVDDDVITLKGKVTKLDSSDEIESFGFYWGEDRDDVGDGEEGIVSPEEVGDDSDELEKNDTFELEIDADELDEDATYYFMAYIVVDGDEYKGKVLSFTISEVDVPEVTTDSATSIKADGATLNGTIDSLGGDDEITEYGFYYGTSSSPNTKKKVGDDDDNIDEDDDFDYKLSGLKADTKYYFKAYAKNSEGTGYGSIKSFTTKEGTPVTTTTSSVFTIGSSYYTLNGSSQVMDAAPYIKNSRTYMPIRYVGYAMGLNDSQIQWYEATRTVILTKGSTTVVLVIGSNTMFVNGVARTLDVAPEITNSRTCLPIAWVAAAFGHTAVWNGATQQVTIAGVTSPSSDEDVELKLSRSSLTLEPGDDATITGTLDVDIDDVDYSISGDRVVSVDTRITGTTFKATIEVDDDADDGDETTITFTVTDEDGNEYEAELDVSVEDDSSGEVEVSTNAATSIRSDSARLNGAVTDDGDLDIDEFGFFFGTNRSEVADGVDGDADYYEADGKASKFYFDIEDLDSNTRYYFMAYALDEDNDETYGKVLNFTTKK